MPKINKTTRVEQLLEENNSNIKLILEHTSELRKLVPRFDKLEEDVTIIKDDVAAMKVGQKGFQERLTKVESKLERRGLKTA